MQNYHSVYLLGPQLLQLVLDICFICSGLETIGRVLRSVLVRLFELFSDLNRPWIALILESSSWRTKLSGRLDE